MFEGGLAVLGADVMLASPAASTPGRALYVPCRELAGGGEVKPTMASR
jgi:hypothetical protein